MVQEWDVHVADLPRAGMANENDLINFAVEQVFLSMMPCYGPVSRRSNSILCR